MILPKILEERTFSFKTLLKKNTIKYYHIMGFVAPNLQIQQSRKIFISKFFREITNKFLNYH